MKNLISTQEKAYTDMGTVRVPAVITHSDSVRAQRRMRHVSPIGTLQRSATPDSIKNLSLVQSKKEMAAHKLEKKALFSNAEETEYIRQLTSTNSWDSFSSL